MSLERLLSDVSPDVARVLESALEGRELSPRGGAILLRTQGGDLHALMRAADLARREDRGDDVSFVVNRNINFTNICYVGCSYCGFSRRKGDSEAYDHPTAVLVEKAREAIARGATEVCIQGGIHPNKDHTHYREILVALKRECPDLHIHAFSPEEIDFGHRRYRAPPPRSSTIRFARRCRRGDSSGTAGSRS
jgi:FO synthase